MSQQTAKEQSLPATDPSIHNKITALGILGALAATVLMGSEIAFADAAAIWALSGFLHVAGITLIVLGVAVSLPAVWACIAIARLAWRAESDPRNN
ncbi:MAG: hypothetical protein R3D45_11945 [Rhizobiaceae bacterium]